MAVWEGRGFNWDARLEEDGLTPEELEAAYSPERHRQAKAEAEAASVLERFRQVTEYSPAQRTMFFESEGNKFRIFPKGRRLGATRGAAHAFIEYMLQGYACLWGDTVNGNIERYLERYFQPALKKANVPYRWDRQKKTLHVGTGYTDFRSADMKLENWEGFGYRRVFLNEAGIILADSYLFDNAVMPMMMDYEDSELIAAGTPKGKVGKNGSKHKYFELYSRARAGESGYFTKTFTSWDNPFLPDGAVEELLGVYGGPETAPARQEVFGEFLDGADDSWQVLPRSWVQLAMERWKAGVGRPGIGDSPDQIGVDPARGGADNMVLALRHDAWVPELQVVPGAQVPTGRHIAALIVQRVAAHTLVQIDLGAVGSSPVDYTEEVHSRTLGINFGTPTKMTDASGRLRMRNYRAAMYWHLRELLDPASEHEVALPPDDLLLEELTAATFVIGAQGVQIQDKAEIKKIIGRSPDRADAVVLACWQAPEPEFYVPGSESFGFGEGHSGYEG